jgi:hypothetical protein
MACTDSGKMFGISKSLSFRYNKFKNSGIREKVLHEIKNNIIHENFLTI